MKKKNKKLIICLLTLALSATCHILPSNAQVQRKSCTLKNNEIAGVITLDGLTLLADPSDSAGGIIIGDRSWGRTHLMYTIEGKNWLQHDAYNKSFVTYGDTAVGIIDYGSGMPLKMEQKYTLTDQGINFDILIESKMQFPVKIGDLAVHFPTRNIPRAWTAWRTGTGENPEYIDEYIFD
ncbi:MAG TPA: hypothetical protein DEQ09_01905, partial [Bacteroidales bacterium]|nr:hypothetical protein [Bacteroidales bacterium]